MGVLERLLGAVENGRGARLSNSDVHALLRFLGFAMLKSYGRNCSETERVMETWIDYHPVPA